MQIKPTLNIVGLKESGNRHFLPHYYPVKDLFPRSRITHVTSKSVMHVQEGLKDLDFWNLDADAFYTEDSIGHTGLMNVGGNHFDYFTGFVKVYRIAHGLFDQDSFLVDGAWTKNKSHMMEIYTNILASDIVWVSPVLKDILRRKLPEVLSVEQLSKVKKKLLVLPPPDFYKLDVPETIKLRPFVGEKLVFLWNHRLVASKNPRIFFETIATVHKKWPKIPLEIRICSLATKDAFDVMMPDELKPFVVYSPFLYDKNEYEKFIRPCNITLGTSEIESFGVSVFDAISRGMTYVNLDKNDAFIQLAGKSTTVKVKELPETIHKLWTDPKLVKSFAKTNTEALRGLPSFDEAQSLLSKAILNSVGQKIETAKGDRSDKLKAALKALDKRALTKQEVYKSLGWPTPTTCRNAYWTDYYWALRKRGIQTMWTKSGQLYFYSDRDHLEKIVKADNKSSSSAGLFGK